MIEMSTKSILCEEIFPNRMLSFLRVLKLSFSVHNKLRKKPQITIDKRELFIIFPEREYLCPYLKQKNSTSSGAESDLHANTPYLLAKNARHATHLTPDVDLSIGKSKGNDLTIGSADDSILGKHCVVSYHQGTTKTTTAMWLRRSLPTASVSINGVSMGEQELWAALNHGDVIILGVGYKNCFLVIDPCEAPVVSINRSTK